jgi:hypothetical protein
MTDLRTAIERELGSPTGDGEFAAGHRHGLRRVLYLLDHPSEIGATPATVPDAPAPPVVRANSEVSGAAVCERCGRKRTAENAAQPCPETNKPGMHEVPCRWEPDREDRGDGQQKGYVILSAEERRKGFVRPVRTSYRHVGPLGPEHALRNLTPGEAERYAKYEYVKAEDYPPGSSAVGRFWTQAQLTAVTKGGCDTVTKMGSALAETYARDPSFYAATFCVGCGTHLPVGAGGEFVWDGTHERVGT